MGATGSGVDLTHEDSSTDSTSNVKTGQQKDTEYEGTNTSNTAASTNTTDTTGTNTTVNSGSTNSTVNSGSTNTSNTAATQNVTTTGPSTSTTNSTTHTSDQINTSQLLLSQAAVDHIVQGILEGSSGLAAVSGGQKAAGAYNTSTNSLLTNDLLSRTAGEVAARSAVTKTVIGGTTSTTSGTTTNSGSTTTQNIGAVNTTQVLGGSTSTTDIGGSTSTNTSDSNATTNIGATSTTQTAKGTSAEDILTDQASTSSSDTSSTKESVKVGWILCTELQKQGRMPKRFYIYGSAVFANYSPAAKRGYYIWAIPALTHLRAHPFSFRSKLMCKLLNARAEYLAAEAGCKSASRTVLGWMSKQLYYGCLLLGYTVARNSTDTYLENSHA